MALGEVAAGGQVTAGRTWRVEEAWLQKWLAERSECV